QGLIHAVAARPARLGESRRLVPSRAPAYAAIEPATANTVAGPSALSRVEISDRNFRCEIASRGSEFAAWTPALDLECERPLTHCNPTSGIVSCEPMQHRIWR